ncbi:small integral membrane protein 4 [Latimeria chalumnae]|uniref:Ubiquinol-cytochrome c reductase complex assembly factor 5 n=1 Tax=Latimeria chalumnae TaxID=7897 RepID=H3A2E2_LATCH|nr:PREDICTED: small integral membrane protein 4 [Latimeria chalumnae]|eukprot:XP_006010395.1 PREDICTED: small integral membrane protein 4 [Latimeria chalumnae]
MKMFLNRFRVKRLLNLFPGKKYLGVYRFLPFFFVLGGVMEWIMINVRIGKESFYDVYRRKQSERQYQQRMDSDGLINDPQASAK